MSVRAEAGQLRVTVVDNGVGVADGVAFSGLANLRSRALGRGGTFDVLPGPSGGTVVGWCVPL